MRKSNLSWVVLAGLSACGGGAPAPSDARTGPMTPASAASVPAPVATSTAVPSAATVATPATADAIPAFVDKVWRVGPGSGVEAGTTYAFLRDGTLLIDAPHGTPSKGRWRYANGRFTMIEEGIAYATDIVSLDATHFVIRSHNPGGAVEIAMVADPDAPVPQAP